MACSKQSVWLLFAWMAVCCMQMLQANPEKPNPVFLFSIDGMRTDYLLQAQQLGLPTLTRLIQAGTLAKGSQTVWPAMTFPSHTSMVTGVSPARHGIWNNNVFGPLDNNANNHYFYQVSNSFVGRVLEVRFDRHLTRARISQPKQYLTLLINSISQ